MKHTWTFTSHSNTPQEYADRTILTLPTGSDDWAGTTPDEYLVPLKRLGYLPLDIVGPLPDSSKLTRLMETESMEDANEYVLSAIDQLQPDLGLPKSSWELDEGQSALFVEWKTHPLWTLSIGVAKPGPIYPEPTVIVRLSTRPH